MTLSNATPVPSPEGHDAAMAAAYDAAVAPKGGEAAPAVTPAAERPTWLPEGINTPEELRAAYDAAVASKTPEASAEAAATATAAEAAAATAAVGIDYTALTNEYMANGELSAERYAELEAKGIPKNMVDGYIEGQVVIAQRFENEVKDGIGGSEQFDQVVQWAATNLPKNELIAFNNAIDSAAAAGDLASAKLLVAGLKARFTDANGSEPNLLGGGSGGSETEVFRSRAEVTSAMSDPRYAKDPAYRADVTAKLGRSNVF